MDVKNLLSAEELHALQFLLGQPGVKVLTKCVQAFMQEHREMALPAKAVDNLHETNFQAGQVQAYKEFLKFIEIFRT